MTIYRKEEMDSISKKSEAVFAALKDGAVSVGRGEVLKRTVLISPDGASDVLPSCFVLGADSVLELALAVLPGACCNLDIAVIFDGEGAQADISGLYICPGAECVNVSVGLLHKAPRCISHQLFKGIAGGSSKVDFKGKIVVAQDAQKTEACQENHNLLLSDTALINTKPQLEIYADDVKCSHGATIGRLNEEEQFYMRSRGISLEDARMLQMISFLSPVTGKFEQSDRQSDARSLIEASLRNL